jgi:hypothetical protein
VWLALLAANLALHEACCCSARATSTMFAVCCNSMGSTQQQRK